MVTRFLCLFNRHTPSGRRADWDGHAYVSRCERCHRAIRRVGKGRWREDSPAAH